MKGLCKKPVRVSCPEPPQRAEAALGISLAPFPLCTREQMLFSSPAFLPPFQNMTERRTYDICYAQPASLCPVTKCGTSAACLHPSIPLSPLSSPMLREKEAGKLLLFLQLTLTLVSLGKSAEKIIWSLRKCESLQLRAKFCSGFCFQLSTISKQSLTADTQLARILDQNPGFTLKAVKSKNRYNHLISIS